MAEVTINIPDPILAIIQKRADITKTTPEQLIATKKIRGCIVRCFPVFLYCFD